MVLKSIHNLCFVQKYEKYQSFFICKFSVFEGEIFYKYLNKVCFRNGNGGTSFFLFRVNHFKKELDVWESKAGNHKSCFPREKGRKNLPIVSRPFKCRL